MIKIIAQGMTGSKKEDLNSSDIFELYKRVKELRKEGYSVVSGELIQDEVSIKLIFDTHDKNKIYGNIAKIK
jgi:DNA-binding IclR family transcriptional regulator